MKTDPERSGADSVWGRRPLAESGDLRLDTGPLRLTLRRRADELWHAAERGAADPQSGVDPETWERWAGSDVSVVRVVPTLPDRPLVVAPEVPFHLTPGTRVRVYARIPVWVRVSFEHSPETPLFEIPTVVLSDTWWGDFVSGELAYWLPITARRGVSGDLFRPHLAMCPLELQNVSDRTLPVERLAVRVVHLSLFRDGDRLWANETHVRYEDEPDGSRIDPGEGPPAEAPNASLLTGPREPVARGLRALTLGRLKDVVGL